jgi:hypothetical protein
LKIHKRSRSQRPRLHISHPGAVFGNWNAPIHLSRSRNDLALMPNRPRDAGFVDNNKMTWSEWLNCHARATAPSRSGLSSVAIVTARPEPLKSISLGRLPVPIPQMTNKMTRHHQQHCAACFTGSTNGPGNPGRGRPTSQSPKPNCSSGDLGTVV